MTLFSFGGKKKKIDQHTKKFWEYALCQVEVSFALSLKRTCVNFFFYLHLADLMQRSDLNIFKKYENFGIKFLVSSQ